MTKNISRKGLIDLTALAATSITIVLGSVLEKSAGHTAPSDELNIAEIVIYKRFIS